MEPTGHLRPKSMSRAGSPSASFQKLGNSGFFLIPSSQFRFFLLFFFNKFRRIVRILIDFNAIFWRCFLEWNDTRRIFTANVMNLSQCYVFGNSSVLRNSNFWYTCWLLCLSIPIRDSSMQINFTGYYVKIYFSSNLSIYIFFEKRRKKHILILYLMIIII